MVNLHNPGENPIFPVLHRAGSSVLVKKLLQPAEKLDWQSKKQETRLTILLFKEVKPGWRAKSTCLVMTQRHPWQTLKHIVMMMVKEDSLLDCNESLQRQQHYRLCIHKCCWFLNPVGNFSHQFCGSNASLPAVGSFAWNSAISWLSCSASERKAWTWFIIKLWQKR